MKTNEYGLVAVTALKAFDNWTKGDVFGLKPEMAKKLIDSEHVELHATKAEKAAKAEKTEQ